MPDEPRGTVPRLPVVSGERVGTTSRQPAAAPPATCPPTVGQRDGPPR